MTSKQNGAATGTAPKQRKHLPHWLKACFIKFWFAGAVYFFIGWGLFLSSADQLDLTLALGAVLGLLTDLIVNKVLFLMEKGGREYHPYVLCWSERWYVSLPVNLVYCVVLSFLVAYTYHFINLFAARAQGLGAGTIVLGAEPILFGLFILLYDLIFLGIKAGIRRIRKGTTT